MKEKAGRNSPVRFLLVTAVCVAFVFLLVAVIIPEYKLNRAEKLIEAGDYKAAYALLDGMEYKNSAEIAADCLLRAQKAGLADVTVGSTVRFGSYEQDNDLSNGPEELEWLVLELDGDRALLVSKYGLEPRPYNQERELTNSYKRVTWSTCELRAWLNGDFFRAAFSPGHQALILLSEVKADKNPLADVDPGRDAKDRIFILSATEAGRYFDSDSARQCPGSAYCLAHSRETENGACRWWLRTSGVEDDGSVSVVTAKGEIFLVGFSCGHEPNPAVRPAMWIGLGGN